MGQAASRKRQIEQRKSALLAHYLAYRSAAMALRAVAPMSEQAYLAPAAALGRIEILVFSNAALALVYQGNDTGIAVEAHAGTSDDFLADKRSGFFAHDGTEHTKKRFAFRAGSDSILEIVPEALVEGGDSIWSLRWARMTFIGHDAVLPDPAERARDIHKDVFETVDAAPDQVKH